MNRKKKMTLYPIFLKLEGKNCVVFGGGEVATRKVESLLKAGARVTVVSPDLSPRLFQLWREEKLTCHYRPYRTGDVRGHVLAVSATNNPNVNREIVAEAREAGVLVNVVDVPELCDFYVPAILQRGDLQIAISTNGTFPALAREIRLRLEKEFNTSFEELLHLAAEIRLRLKKTYPDPVERQRMIDTVIVPRLLADFESGLTNETRKALEEWT